METTTIYLGLPMDRSLCITRIMDKMITSMVIMIYKTIKKTLIKTLIRHKPIMMVLEMTKITILMLSIHLRRTKEDENQTKVDECKIK